MIAVLALLALAALVWWLLACQGTQRSDRRRREQLVHRARQADIRIARDQREAKRAMNDAAGQSWRNRFE